MKTVYLKQIQVTLEQYGAGALTLCVVNISEHPPPSRTSQEQMLSNVRLIRQKKEIKGQVRNEGLNCVY